MKRILTYTTFCLLLVFASCSEEQLEVYHGDNYVYFTYMSDKSPQKITFNFATDAPLLREGTVKVKMTLLGYLLEENATCDISAVGEKSTARSGIDYAPLTSGIFHKGLAEDTYEVTVYRNEALLNTEYTLTLSLDAVENCLVGPAEYQYVTIQVTDRISCPVWWSQSSAANLGVYSDMKYRVFYHFHWMARYSNHWINTPALSLSI